MVLVELSRTDGPKQDEDTVRRQLARDIEELEAVWVDSDSEYRIVSVDTAAVLNA